MQTTLIESTIRLLAEQGPWAIKARTVASASGLSTMVVYSHFGGIPELLSAVTDYGFKELARAFSQVSDTDDPVADLCSMALTTRRLARANPHLYDLMFGLSTRSTYRARRGAEPPLSGRSPDFVRAYEQVIRASARLAKSGRVGNHDPRVLAGQLWSFVHGFVSLELADHFVDFDDPPIAVLLPLINALAVSVTGSIGCAEAREIP